MTLYDNMVQQTAPRLSGHPPPPVCPQCGNHRTEVVDSTESPRRMMIRCNACGMHSVLRGDGDGGTARNTDATGVADTGVGNELDVIRAISLALAHLPDADA